MAQPKKITQETFDAVVRENIEEFEMDLHEAIEDAKDQFKTQGVDLSNLITSYIQDPDTGELKHSNPVKGTLVLYWNRKSKNNNTYYVRENNRWKKLSYQLIFKLYNKNAQLKNFNTPASVVYMLRISVLCIYSALPSAIWIVRSIASLD